MSGRGTPGAQLDEISKVANIFRQRLQNRIDVIREKREICQKEFHSSDQKKLRFMDLMTENNLKVIGTNCS